MFTRLFKVAAGIFFALAANACVSTTAYVENGHDKADFRDLQPRNPPTPVLVTSIFTVNGREHPEVNTAVFNEVVRVLQRTRVLTPVSADPGLTLTVAVDDAVDLDAARTAGVVTGLSEGLTGSIVRDEYHFTYTLLSRDGKPQTGLYRHAMITVSGRAAPASYGQPHPAGDAFYIIVKQSVLEFLSDLESVNSGEPALLVPDVSDGK